MKNPLWICYAVLAYLAVFSSTGRSEVTTSFATIAIPICLTITIWVHLEMQRKRVDESKSIDSTKQELDIVRGDLERARAEISSVKAMVALKSTVSYRE